MRILVCGNGPSLPIQLKDLSLDSFDKVVRVNTWKPIDGYDNRCDAWVNYYKHFEMFDLSEYLKVKELWLPHHWSVDEYTRLANRKPDYILDNESFNSLLHIMDGASPTTGLWAIYMAMLIGETWIAGFDFYENCLARYYKCGTELATCHDPKLEKKIAQRWITEGEVKKV